LFLGRLPVGHGGQAGKAFEPFGELGGFEAEGEGNIPDRPMGAGEEFLSHGYDLVLVDAAGGATREFVDGVT
jgi:hypothetical protein